MSEDQKIWFVYLTDHHEGPFTPAEVGEKVAAGLVNAQTLGWKDGMAEWVAVETIPELAAVLKPAEAQAPTEAPDPNFSLASMLAKQQAGGEAPPEENLAVTSGAEALASFATAANPSANGENPAPDEDAWSLKVNGQVSGLYSLNRLKVMAANGDIPGDAQLWHKGWVDFQTVALVPEVAGARKPKAAGGTQTNLSYAATGKTAAFKRPAGIVTAAAHANPGKDDVTDTGISAPPAAGLKGLVQKVTGKFQKKPAPAKAKPSFSSGGTQKIQAPAKKAGGGKLRSLALMLGTLAIVGGGAGAAYFFLLASPFPADLDVTPDDLELMTETAKAPVSEGGRLYLAVARGSENAPADDATPKFYLATNLPEGKSVMLHLVGKSGTLVNRLSFEKDFTATVGKNHLAVFERLDDNGKPLPAGEYTLSLSADGAAPLSQDKFLGGRKTAAYTDRLKKYKDKLQGEYDKEMQDLREIIDTLKSMSGEIAKRIADYKAGWGVAANHARLTADWKTFALSASPIAQQLEQKVKAHTLSGSTTYQPRAFQDVSAAIAQLQQVLTAQGARMDGAAPAGDPDALLASLQASVANLEQLLAQALVKSPVDLLNSQGAGKASPKP